MEIDEDELRDAVMAEEDPLEGLTFVISGEFEGVSRSRLEELVREKGGRLTQAVSGKTNYLIVGYKLEDGREVTQGSKYASAKKHGTTILTESQFEEFMKKKLNDPDYTLSSRRSYGITEDSKSIMDMPKRESVGGGNNGEMSNEMWTDVYAP